MKFFALAFTVLFSQAPAAYGEVSKWATAAACENRSIRFEYFAGGTSARVQMVFHHQEFLKKLIAVGAVNASDINEKGEWILSSLNNNRRADSFSGYASRDEGFLFYNMQLTETTVDFQVSWGLTHEAAQSAEPFFVTKFYGCQ